MAAVLSAEYVAQRFVEQAHNAGLQPQEWKIRFIDNMAYFSHECVCFLVLAPSGTNRVYMQIPLEHAMQLENPADVLHKSAIVDQPIDELINNPLALALFK